MTQEKRTWLELFKVQNKQWMSTIDSIMRHYCTNIDGSTIEVRSASIVWNYKNAEEEHGSKFANKLVVQIQNLIGRNSPIDVINRNGFVEVLPKKLNKKVVLSRMLDDLKHFCNHQIERFLYIGHDLSCNSIFQYLKDRVEKDMKKSEKDN